MPIWGWLKGLSLAARLILALALTLLIGGLIVHHFWSSAASAKMQSKIDTGQLSAFGNSAEDAITTQSNVGDFEQRAHDLSAHNEKEIRHAKGSDTTIDPAAQLAGVRALCSHPSNRGSPSCRMYQPDPAELVEGNSER